jgi:hypothetical protein
MIKKHKRMIAAPFSRRMKINYSPAASSFIEVSCVIEYARTFDFFTDFFLVYFLGFSDTIWLNDPICSYMDLMS